MTNNYTSLHSSSRGVIYQQGRGFFQGVDISAILLYLLIVIAGCVCITSASFDEMSLDHFAFSHFYIKQIIWAGVALVAAVTVLLIDANFFHKYSYLLYFFGVILLLTTLVFGREVNGAKSWFEFGAFRFQPVEVVKITTSIALARVMSEYSFSINKISSLMRVILIVAAPLGIIIMQNDTGSGIVFCSFIFVLYREGLSRWLCVPLFFVAVLFILSFVLSQFVLLVISLGVVILINACITREIKYHLIYIAVVTLCTVVLKLITWVALGEAMDSYSALLLSSFVLLVPMLWVFVNRRLIPTLILSVFYILSTIFVQVCDFIFTSILRPHQQNRIMSFLGMVSDPLGAGYNVNQSKIAIGSGGLFGKGFLDGTQIRYGFVPEKHTDFIFCALSEEWGFVGVLFVLGCFMLLILKLMSMGERQNASFGRIYCYCVASILLFHIFVNVGMTIGLMPVMGIPLPFMSYGGSSLLAFTIMLFIAFRLDAARIR